MVHAACTFTYGSVEHSQASAALMLQKSHVSTCHTFGRQIRRLLAIIVSLIDDSVLFWPLLCLCPFAYPFCDRKNLVRACICFVGLRFLGPDNPKQPRPWFNSTFFPWKLGRFTQILGQFIYQMRPASWRNTKIQWKIYKESMPNSQVCSFGNGNGDVTKGLC